MLRWERGTLSAVLGASVLGASVLGASLAASAAPIKVELRTRIDSRSAKAGDAVFLCRWKASPGNANALPKDACLLGHVRKVRDQGAAGQPEISLMFDQLHFKDGHLQIVKAAIVAVYAAPGQTIPNWHYGADHRGFGVAPAQYDAPDIPAFRVLYSPDSQAGTVIGVASGPRPLILEKGARFDVLIASPPNTP